MIGVIIVLSVIALITVPVVTKVMNDSRKNSFKVSAENLVEAANNYYADNQLIIDKTLTFNFASGGKTDTGIKLAYKGVVPTGGRLVLNADGGVALIDVSDGKYYANYDSTGDDTIIVGDTNVVLTRDEITQAINDIKAELKTKVNKNDLLDKTYPVGSIYTSVKNTNPSSIYGGTWVAFGSGRTLVGVNNDDSDFNTVEKTGGSESASVTLTTSNLPSHNHSIPALSGGTSGVGDHTHYIPALSGSTNAAGNHTHLTGMVNASMKIYSSGWDSMMHRGDVNAGTIPTSTNGNHAHNLSTNANNTGGSGSHSHTISTNANNTGASGNGSAFSVNKLQPYITVYMWKRTA